MPKRLLKGQFNLSEEDFQACLEEGAIREVQEGWFVYQSLTLEHKNSTSNKLTGKGDIPLKGGFSAIASWMFGLHVVDVLTMVSVCVRVTVQT